MSVTGRASLGFALVAAILAAGGGASQAVQLAGTPVTPPGIKIADLPQGPVFVTAKGMTIYKQLPMIAGWGHAKKQADAGGSCVYACPNDWPPLKAPADAKPVGDFTVVKAADGSPQWAYKGVPLETFAYDRHPGDTIGEDTYAFNGPRVPVGEAAWIESDTPPAKPADPPAPSADIPPGVTVQPGMAANRYFANAAGITLYTLDGDPKGTLLEGWVAFPAGSAAHSIGDWSVVAHDDGTKQWAYKGKPVFYSAKDDTPGEPSESGITTKFRPMVEYQAPIPAEIGIRVADGTGAATSVSEHVFTEKATGKTLYYEGFTHRPYQFVGFNHKGSLYGTVNCYNECAKTYPPLLAPADAKPMGEWWVITRADGTKQWGYRGIPVYTYSADEPGQKLASYRGHIWTEALANNRSGISY